MKKQITLAYLALRLPQIGLALMVVACQSKPVLPEMDAIDGNDKTLVMNGCETSIDRGAQVCRFMQGSPMDNTLRILFPWNEGVDMAGEVRLRVGSFVYSRNVTSNTVSIPYRELFNSKTWELEHDGPIQILGSYGFADGSGVKRTKVLGYLYVIVLKKGYTPSPVFWSESFSHQVCRVLYSQDGRSSVFCSSQ